MGMDGDWEEYSLSTAVAAKYVKFIIDQCHDPNEDFCQIGEFEVYDDGSLSKIASSIHIDYPMNNTRTNSLFIEIKGSLSANITAVYVNKNQAQIFDCNFTK